MGTEMESTDGPKVPEELFMSVKYYLIGNIDEKVQELLSDGGGKQECYMSEMITHVVADDPEADEVSEAKDLFELTVVTSQWVVMSAKCKCLMPTCAFQLTSDMIFASVVACPSQVAAQDSRSLWALITYNGGKCQRVLNKKVTHLICTRPRGAKYERAMQNNSGIKIVTPDWITECIKEKKRIPEEIYHPRLLILTPPPEPEPSPEPPPPPPYPLQPIQTIKQEEPAAPTTTQQSVPISLPGLGATTTNPVRAPPPHELPISASMPGLPPGFPGTAIGQRPEIHRAKEALARMVSNRIQGKLESPTAEMPPQGMMTRPPGQMMPPGNMSPIRNQPPPQSLQQPMPRQQFPSHIQQLQQHHLQQHPQQHLQQQQQKAMEIQNQQMHAQHQHQQRLQQQMMLQHQQQQQQMHHMGIRPGMPPQRMPLGQHQQHLQQSMGHPAHGPLQQHPLRHPGKPMGPHPGQMTPPGRIQPPGHVTPPASMQSGHLTPPANIQTGHLTPPGGMQPGHVTPPSLMQQGHITPPSHMQQGHMQQPPHLNHIQGPGLQQQKMQPHPDQLQHPQQNQMLPMKNLLPVQQLPMQPVQGDRLAGQQQPPGPIHGQMQPPAQLNSGANSPRTLQNITNKPESKSPVRPKQPLQTSPVRSALAQQLNSQSSPIRQPVPLRQEVRYYGHDPMETVPPEVCLLGCVFYITDYQKLMDPAGLECWRMKIAEHGGMLDDSYSNRVTHLLCENQRSDVFHMALRDNKRLVTAHWLNDVLSEKKMQPPWRALHIPTVFGEKKPCSNQILCVSNFVGDERTRVKQMILALGARYTGFMTHANSAIICKQPGGTKYQRALEWRIPVVNVMWLTDLLLGKLEALKIPINVKYQQFNTEGDPFKVELWRLAPLLEGWKTPIRVSKEAWKLFVPSMVLKSAEMKRKMEERKLLEVPKRSKSEDSPPFNPDGAPVVLVTGITRKEAEGLAEMVERLGGHVVQSARHNVTHLVARTVSRTVKFLSGFSTAKHIVTPEWVEQSAVENKFLDEANFVLRDPRAENEAGFNIQRSNNMAQEQKVFNGMVFYATPSVIPSVKVLKEIIECGGGQVVEKRPSVRNILNHKGQKGDPTFIVISTENDIHMCQDLLLRRIAVYNPEFIISSILKQKVVYNEFTITMTPNNLR